MGQKNIILLEDADSRKMFPSIETFPCPSQEQWGNGAIIRIIFPEFTCMCPKTGYPDFASIDLYYLPDTLCIELKSWKLYLNAFRMVGTFHETLTAHLFITVTTLLSPRWLMLAGDFFPRGNVNTTVVFETDTPRPSAAGMVLKNYSPHCRTFS